eukprot:SAG31_NODE_2375_length_5842_cov_1.832318_3_plen_137_part_00
MMHKPDYRDAPQRNSPSTPLEEDATIQYGRRLCEEKGFVVACTEAYPFNLIPVRDETGFSQWEAATKVLLSENPKWTGMGKLVHDCSLALSLLLGPELRPWVGTLDAGKVLSIGHSLGGKIAFYAAALGAQLSRFS